MIAEFRRQILEGLHRKRRASGMAGYALAILMFSIIAIIGVLIFSKVVTALPTLAGTANTTVVAFVANYYAGLELLGVGIIVMAAVGIIGIVVAMGRQTT